MSKPAPAPDPWLHATIFLLALFEFLQAGMTAFAAAPIMGGTGIGPEAFSAVAAVYASVAIVALSMHRWLVERLGGRRFIQAAAAVSVLGAVLCATSHDVVGFLVGRAVMALGGGVFFTACRMIIHHRLAGPRRFAGIRFLGSGLAIGIAAAPWLASLAVSNDAWPVLYGGLAALAALIFVLAGLTLDAGPAAVADAPRSGITGWQQGLLGASSFLLLYALQRLCYDFDSDAAADALVLGTALAGLGAYLWLQHRGARPLLRVRGMLHVRYLTGLAVFLFAYVMLGANNTIVPSMLQGTLGFAWSTVGHVEALAGGAALLTWVVVSRLLPRHPAPRKYLVAGFLALALFGAAMTRMDTDASLLVDLLPPLALNSVFLLTVLPVTAMQTFREMEHAEPLFSNAQQLKNMLSQAGIALGIALATVGQQWRTALHYSILSARIDAGDPVFDATLQRLQHALESTLAPAEATRAALARVAQMVAQQAAMLAHIDHFGTIALLGVLGIGATLVQRVFR
jgi:MFS family permease